MAETTISFRIVPPLYGLQDAAFTGPEFGRLDISQVTLTLVDSGQPQVFKVVTKGRGGVSMPGDNLGERHNTRVDIQVPGSLAETQQIDADMLTGVVNRMIDWYRVVADRPTVRRITPIDPTRTMRVDTDGQQSIGLMVGPGDRSTTAGHGDSDLIAKVRLRLSEELPLWIALTLDAQAELAANELRVAVLLANSGMETLINHAFRTVAPADEVTAELSTGEPAPFWKLLKRTNQIVRTGQSNTKLSRLAGRVHQYRDDVSHGNPVSLDAARVADGVTALAELINIVTPAVAQYTARSDPSQPGA